MNKSNQNGLSLIEVMIALAVFSFGLLALAALMASGLKYNTSALHRSYATSQAYDLADRMRANNLWTSRSNFTAYILVGNDKPDLNCIVPESGTISEVNCRPDQMAYSDFMDWRNANARLLPGGRGKVSPISHQTFDPESADFGIYRITVSWNDDRDPETAAASFDFDFRP
jgi:type IV pilus assembly protein PilV